ncbi:MAG: CDP-glycerol glycerophosphotransferase family protein [Nanoarchaeota archaeon]|nr:CDP-glycerol glycerophosphotransferase family protein [Nanoarchaeota archaeon]
MKELIFVDFDGFKVLKESDKKNTILIDYPPSTNDPKHTTKDIEKFNIEEFFPKKILKNSEEEAERIHNEFYKRISGKIIYKNIDLFSPIKNLLMLNFVLIIKYIKIFNYIIKDKKPKKVLIISKEYSNKKPYFSKDNGLILRALLEVCSYNKIPTNIKTLKINKKRDYKKYKNVLYKILGKIQNRHFFFKVHKNDKTILFIGGKNAYLPILNYLKCKIIRVRCGLTLANSFFNNDQDYYITFGDKTNLKRFKLSKSIDVINNPIRYKGYNISKVIKLDLKYIISDYFNLMSKWIDLAYNIEPRISKAVMTNDTLPFEQILIKILHKNKKPCYVIQHAYTTAPEGQFPLVKNKILADKMFVWGKSSLNWMIRNGVKKNRLILTGSIKFDSYKYINFDVKDRLNIPKNKKIIVYIAEGSHKFQFPEYAILEKERVSIYRNLYNTIKEMEDYYLIVKLHPSDIDPNTPKIIADECDIHNYSIVNGNFPIQSLLKISNLVISIYSSAILEAIYFKKPVLILDYFKKVDYIVPFLKFKMCLGLNNKNMLKEYIIKLEKDKDIFIKTNKKLIKNFIYKNDGNAYKRISKEILKGL